MNCAQCNTETDYGIITARKEILCGGCFERLTNQAQRADKISDMLVQLAKEKREKKYGKAPEATDNTGAPGSGPDGRGDQRSDEAGKRSRKKGERQANVDRPSYFQSEDHGGDSSAQQDQDLRKVDT